MNKTEKRQFDLRNKLIAAIAMLLVSCIMMVSTTYAWFTLSTAPEIQGITTTVGANGNLEIALSPYSGNADDITTKMGDANLGWAEKNLTWGNLLNLSDNSVYGLEDIALLPSRLNIQQEGSMATLNSIPLKTPTYGADGRPQALNANTTIGSRIESVDAEGNVTTAAGFLANSYKGIRVIGTSSSQTEQEMTYNSSLSELSAAISNAKSFAQNSLNNNGGDLTGMAIQHGLVDGEDTNNYKEYVDGLRAVLTDLEKANASLIEGVKAALLAEAASSASSAEKYAAAVAAITDDATIASIQASAYGQNYMTTDADILATINLIASNATSIAAASTKLSALEDEAKTNVSWTEISEVLTPLMNTSKIKINNLLMSDFMALGTTGIGNNILKNGLNITMVAGSGLYADFGTAVGDLTASVLVPEFEYGGQTLGGWDAYMETDSEPADGAHMIVVRNTIAGYGVLVIEGGNGAKAYIDVPYAYMVDFLFRTNASNSNLMLQTSPAQRVYEDSTSSATQGHGSTMSFAITEDLSAEATLNLMKAIRVVFLDTESLEVYGIAKIDTAIYELEGANLENLTEIEGDLYLHNYTINEDGSITFGSRIAEDSAILCGLGANTPKGISALVYLDGDHVTNADVANGVTSMQGAMNLQFASDANLVPMENTALQNMQGAGEYKATAKINGMDYKTVTVTQGSSYSLTIAEGTIPEGATVEVVVTMGGEVLENAWDANAKKISIDNVTGEIVINVTYTE